MDEELKKLKASMDASTLKGKHFTKIQKTKIREKMQSEAQLNRPVKNRFPLLMATIAATLFIIFVLYKQPMSIQLNDSANGVNEWDTRDTYQVNNQELFTLFPDPTVTANGEYGYLFSFKEPFETYEGKDISIYAINKNNGERLMVLPAETINAPSPGYNTLNRFTTVFSLPEAGIWKLEIRFDNQYYGDVVLAVPNNNLPPFVTKEDFQKIDWNQKATRFNDNMIGNEHKSGIIGTDQPSVKHNQKWMWHLWGIKNPTVTKLTIVGYHKESETAHQILTTGWSIDLWGSNNGADAHVPSSVNIPKSGQWAILLYTNEELFDMIVLEME